MEVILIKPVRKIGTIGEIIKVKDGFGRNYLIPKNFAVRATKQNKELIEQQKHDFEVNNSARKLEAENIATFIANKEIMFIMQSADDGKLFGSVGNKDIAKQLSDSTNYKITRANILLNTAIKTIGVFSVEVTLHPEVSVNILVIIARSESESTSLLNNYKSSITNISVENDESVTTL